MEDLKMEIKGIMDSLDEDKEKKFMGLFQNTINDILEEINMGGMVSSDTSEVLINIEHRYKLHEIPDNQLKLGL